MECRFAALSISSKRSCAVTSRLILIFLPVMMLRGAPGLPLLDESSVPLVLEDRRRSDFSFFSFFFFDFLSFCLQSEIVRI